MHFPVYQLQIKEYTFNQHVRPSHPIEWIEYQGTPRHTIKIPKVYWDVQPDFVSIGHQIDKFLIKYFEDRHIIIRALSSNEHPGKSVDDLVQIIQEIGHDRYDPDRKGDRYENIDGHHFDIFGLECIIEKKGNYFDDMIRSFYFWPSSQGRLPVRIDLAIIYDRSKLKVVPHRYAGRENELKKDGFVFNDQGNRSDAIIGIIRIS